MNLSETKVTVLVIHGQRIGCGLKSFLVRTCEVANYMELGVNKDLGAKRQAGTSEKPREPRRHTHETKMAAGNDMLSLGALQHAGVEKNNAGPDWSVARQRH